MKRVLLMVFSILLVLACLFSLFAGVAGVRDILNIKDYKQADADFARESLKTAREGIAQLKENEEVYLTGVGTYTDGLSQYAAGQKSYNDGQAALKAGEKTLAEGYAKYEAGKKAYAEGQAKIDANTQAYNEGKEKLAKIEPLMPYLNQYVQFRDGTIGKLPGFDNAQAWFVGVVRPIAKNLGIDIPADVTDFPAFMNQMVADGKAQLKEYEDGLAQLEAGKAEIAAGEAALKAAEKQLADGEAQLAAGANELAAGAAKLAAGKADLETFEGGMALVDEYTMTCYKNSPIYRHNGAMAVPGPEQRLGSDFDWKKYDENGELMTLRTGDPYLDLDQCLVVCKSFRESVADHVADVTNELTMRFVLYLALAITSLLAIVSASLALAGKRISSVLGIITAALALVCNVFGIATRYHGYTYPLKDGTYSGTLQLVGIILFTVVAVAFAVIITMSKKPASEPAAVEAEA